MTPRRRARVPAAALFAPFVLLALSGLSAGCGFVADPDGRPVLSIGDRDYTHAEFDEFVTARTALGIPVDAALLSVLFDEFVREQLFLIAADDAGIEVSAMRVAAEVSALERLPGAGPGGGEAAAAEPAAPAGPPPVARRQVRNRLRIERLLETELLGDLAPSDEAALLEFESGLPFYSRPETVSLSERAFEDREEAEAALAEIRAAASETGNGGEPGAEGPSAPEGFAAIGAFRRGELPEAVGEVVFELEAGDTTEVIETATGFRIYRVEEHQPGGRLEFEEVEEVVQLTVLRREADARIAAFLEDLRARHPVEVHAARLRFPYVGLLAEP